MVAVLVVVVVVELAVVTRILVVVIGMALIPRPCTNIVAVVTVLVERLVTVANTIA